MTNGATAGASAAAAAAAIAQAIKASGAIVEMKPAEFMKILAEVPEPLVVFAQGGVFATKYSYLTSCKGLFFYTRSREELRFPIGTRTVRAKKIWIPG